MRVVEFSLVTVREASFYGEEPQFMESIRCAEKRIRSVISRSQVPEDPLHAENTLAWVLKLMPEADEAMKIAALGHDIDRAVENRRVQKHDFRSFDDFKAAHASNSADILESILEECCVEEPVKVEACRLVRLHETGGDERSDTLKYADSMSFFENNIPLYFARNGWTKTKQRALWGYGRLSSGLRRIVAEFRYESDELNALLKEVVRQV
jgi:hypothetical protein